MKRILIPALLITSVIIIHCSKPCKNPDMNIDNIDMPNIILDMSSMDACQINPATELCLDLRGND